MEASRTVDHPHRLLARAAAVVGLLGIALIHLLDLQAKLDETPYLGVLYIVLIIASVAMAGTLIRLDDRRAWITAAGLALLTLFGYAVNRTIGMPSATEDIGNWLEPLGLASLFVEATTAAVAVYALTEGRERGVASTQVRAPQRA